MQRPREEYYTEFFNRLKALEGAGTVNTVSRRLAHWNDVSADMQPYIGVAQVRERGSYNAGRTTAWYLDLVIYVYVTEPSPEGNPSTLLNKVLDLIESVFPYDDINQNTCTMGGMVHYVRIAESGTDTDEGTLGSQAVARIPMEMLAY